MIKINRKTFLLIFLKILIMKLPNQSAPIIRGSQPSFTTNDVQPSGACEIACSFLPWPASSICKAAC